MTEEKTVCVKKYALALVSLFLIIFSFLNLKEMMRLINNGLSLCIRSVIPSLFPFMIFSDIILCGNVFDIIPWKIKSLFGKIFNVSPIAADAFLTGIICGFPLGIKYVSDLYRNSAISKEELERLICFCNNTGPAFVIAGIGSSIRNSIIDGVILYFIQVLSALICGILISAKKISDKKENKKEFSCIKSFSLIESVKKSSLNMLYICAMVSFFTVLCGYFGLLFKNEKIYAILSAFLEIGNGASACALLKNRRLSFTLTAGAISFSGMSVHLQAGFFLHEIDIKKKKYYTSKIMQAIFSMVIAFFISLLTY